MWCLLVLRLYHLLKSPVLEIGLASNHSMIHEPSPLKWNKSKIILLWSCTIIFRHGLFFHIVASYMLNKTKFHFYPLCCEKFVCLAVLSSERSQWWIMNVGSSMICWKKMNFSANTVLMSKEKKNVGSNEIWFIIS